MKNALSISTGSRVLGVTNLGTAFSASCSILTGRDGGGSSVADLLDAARVFFLLFLDDDDDAAAEGGWADGDGVWEEERGEEDDGEAEAVESEAAVVVEGGWRGR